MTTINLNEYLRLYNGSRLKIDRSFQRKLCWTTWLANRFFESFTRNRVPSPHIMVDVLECLEFSKQEEDTISEEYYQKLADEGTRSLSLDAQQRGNKLLALMQNRIAISGDFIDADGREVRVKNVFFKDLPRRLQDHFRTGCPIQIVVYKDVLKNELSKIFRAINSGQPLNPQEIRSSTLTPIAPWVRQQTDVYADVLRRITTPDNIMRMLDDENVAKIAMVLSRDKTRGLAKSDIDSWYTMGENYNTLNDAGCPYGKSEIKRIEEILKMFGSVIMQQTVYPPSRLVPKKVWWAALHACEWVYDNNCVIHSRKDFFKRLKELDDELTTKSELEYSQARSACIGKGTDPDEISKQGYYFRWQSLPHQILSRKRRKEALFNQMIVNKASMTIRERETSAKAAA